MEQGKKEERKKTHILSGPDKSYSSAEKGEEEYVKIELWCTR
jgi:hypothetical protein